jgi:ketosteroid isomerase-like protein
MKTLGWLLGIVLAGVVVSCARWRDDTTASEEQVIRAIYNRFSAAVASRDIDAIMSFYVPGGSLVAFDAFPPRQYVGAAAYRKDYEQFFASFPGPAKSEASDIHIETAGTLGFAHGIDRWVVTGKDGQPLTVVFRFTDVLRKINGKWLIVHEHLSVPVDPVTGKADFLSKP